MSRAALAIQEMSVPGLASITLSAPNGAGAGNGNTITGYDSRTFILVNNGDTAPKVITITNQQGIKDRGVTIPSSTVTVSTSSHGIVWVPPEFYVSTAGVLAVDIDATTSVTWAAIHMPASM